MINSEQSIVECKDCGKFFNKSLEVCPFCGLIFEKSGKRDMNSQEEKIEKENTKIMTKKAFVLCPVCKNKYDLSVGTCAFCGYSDQKDEYLLDDSQDSTSQHIVDNIELDDSDINSCKSKQNENQLSVRENLLSYFERNEILHKLLNISSVLIMIYPICLVFLLFETINGFSRFVYKIEDLLTVVFHIGVVLCFSKNQKGLLALSFGMVAIYYFVTIIKHINFISFNEVFSCGLYVVLCILFATKIDENKRVV